MNEEYELINNEMRRQYEFHVDGHIPKIEYVINNNNDIFLTHTEVHPMLRGRGIATQLVERSLCDIEDKGLHLVPLCPFVSAYVKAHPDWMRIVKKGVNIR